MDPAIEQEIVLNNKEIDWESVLNSLASQPSHYILISQINITEPCRFQIQLADNHEVLNELMDSMELFYDGVESKKLDMPIEFVKASNMCVARYPGDDYSWHRCLIMDVCLDKMMARLSFIDYGGDALVSTHKLKYLSKKFVHFPKQTVDAKFANIKVANNKQLRRNMINYLLNRVTNKLLLAVILGLNNKEVALDVYDNTRTNNRGCLAGTSIHLNQRIALDGYGHKYNETADKKVIFLFF